MINICISRIEGKSDYDNFGNSSKFKEGILRERPNVIHYRYFYRKQDNVTTLIIKGIDFEIWDDGNAFIRFFKNNNQSISKDNGVSELTWLLDVFKKIINKIDSNLWGKNKNENKVNLFIHWGGEGRYEATNRLFKTATKLESFPFDVITWSTQDEIKLSVEHLFNLDDSEEIIKCTEELLKSYEALDTKKKIIEIKQKTISKWLPLAIDLQGLSNIKDEIRLNYIKDIYSQRDKNYHKQLLVNFWNMITGFDKKFMGVKQQTNYSRHLKKLLSDYNVKGIDFTEYFSNSNKNGAIDILLTSSLDDPDKNSPLVQLMILLDNYNTSDLEEFPDELSKFLNENDDFYFPKWLHKLEQQFTKLSNDIALNRLKKKN